MPVLMVALMALAAFGAIGGLLLAASVLEHKRKSAESSPATRNSPTE